MLFEDITTGALIYGVLIDIENTSEEEIIALNNLIEQTPLTLFIPGDTVYVSFEDGYLESGILGIIAASACAYESPAEVTNTHLTNAQKAFEQARNQAASTKNPRVEAALKETPTFYLGCCGPLPLTMLVCGARLPRAKSGEAQYRFFGHQDMDQYPMSSGVDGLLIESVEFADIATVSLNETQLERWKDRVPKISNPGIYLITSYD